jgi:hypothetical protein
MTPTDLSSADKNEILGVKEQSLKIDKGKHLQLSKKICVYINEKCKMFVLTNADFLYNECL